MSDQSVKGNDFYLNHNDRKTSPKQPNLRGNMKLSVAELQALIGIYKRAQERNEEPVLQIDIAGWTSQDRDNGNPFVFCRPEIYTGERKKKEQVDFSGF